MMQRGLLAGVILLVLAGPFWAAEPAPRPDLLTLVPKETSLCLVLRGFTTHSKYLAESPFAQMFARSRLGQSLIQSEELKKIESLNTVLIKELQTSLGELRDELLSESVVFAYQPGPANQDSGIILASVRNPKRVQQILDQFHKLQQSSGELRELQEKKHAEQSYLVRVRRDGVQEFVSLTDNLLSFSRSEAALQSTLAARARPPAESRFSQMARRLKLDQAAASVLFEPRSWDDAIQAQATQSENPQERQLHTQFAAFWRSLDAVGIGATLQHDAEVMLSLSFFPDKVPGSFAPLLKPTPESELWTAIPENALMAMAGQVDFSAWLTFAETFLNDQDRLQLRDLLKNQIAPLIGKDLVPALSKNLGPDLGFWVTPHPQSGFAATLAVRVKKDADSDPKLARALLEGLDFLGQTLRIQYNRDHDEQVHLEEIKLEGETLRTFRVGKKPDAMAPTFGIRGNYLILSTHLEPVRTFKIVTPSAGQRPSPNRVFQLNAVGLQKLLTTQKSPLRQLLAPADPAPADWEESLGQLTDLLALLKSVQGSVTTSRDSMIISLRLEPIAPLKAERSK
jgi:hypothetical protein